MLDFGGMSSTNLLEGHKHIFTLMKSLKKIAGLFKKDRLHRIMVMKTYCACLYGGLIHSNRPMSSIMWWGGTDSSALRHT